MSTPSLSRILPADAARTHPRYAVWKHVIPLPPDGLMWSTGGSSLENFLVVGDAWAQVIGHFAPPASRALDIGCGCGRAARTLLANRSITDFIGFDVIPESIEWCNRFIAPAWAGAAQFYCFDLYSAEYNPGGKLQAADFGFPAESNSVDVAFAASVFTHLLEPVAVHYLREIRRVMTGRGRAILSIHDSPPPGVSFSGSEARIDIAPAYFAELGRQAGLRVEECIDDLCGQRVFVFAPG